MIADTKEESELGRKFETGNTKNETKRCAHKDQGYSNTINTDYGSKGEWRIKPETYNGRARQPT